MTAIAGIDAHKDTLAAAIIDERGRPIEALQVSNDREGFTRLIGRLGANAVAVVGIEGSGGFGRPLALELTNVGMAVVEVPAQLTAQSRRRQRSQSKTDDIDALLIARIALREPQLPQIRPDGELEELRVLVRYRRELLQGATASPTGCTPIWNNCLATSGASAA